MSQVELTDDNFQSEVLDYDGLVLVDFWASWCMPCQMLGPIIEQISKELGDKVKVGKINVEEHQQYAQKYNVMSIPMVILFKKGKIVEQFLGVRLKEEYMDAIEKIS